MTKTAYFYKGNPHHLKNYINYFGTMNIQFFPFFLLRYILRSADLAVLVNEFGQLHTTMFIWK